MLTQGTDFIIVESNKGADVTMSGHGTTVRRVKTLNGDIVEKNINPEGAFQDDSDRWMQLNVNAKQIADEMRAKNNSAYVVPRTFISHGKVRESLAAGVTLRNAIKDNPQWLSQNHDWIVPAIAAFINDMSELRPVKYLDKNPSLGGVRIRNVSELRRALNYRGPDVVSPEHQKLIEEIYNFLCDCPENKEMVFGHNDLHPDNIFAFRPLE